MLYLINGPPRSGKDAVARMIHELVGAAHWKLAAELKERTHALYRLMGNGRPRHWSAYERTKDNVSGDFDGVTPRAAYIAVHEGVLKPLHGPTVLGHLLVDRHRRGCEGRKPAWLDPEKNVVVSDAGDVPQCLPLISRFTPERTVLVRLTRAGCDWDNRKRIESLACRAAIDLDNDGTIAELSEKLRRALVGLLT